jgi:surface protein
VRKTLILIFFISFACSKEDSTADNNSQALISSLNAQISALNAQISAMNSEISALQSQVAENSNLESQINDVQSQLNAAQVALEQSNSLLSQKTLDLEDAQNTIIGLVDIIDNLNREFALIELSIVLWIQRAAGFYEFEYYENNVYVGTFSWEIGLTENNDIIWNSYYLSGNCYVKNSNSSFGDDVQFYFTEVSFDDLGVGAYNVDGFTVGLPDYDKVILVESYTIDSSGGLEVMLSAYDINQNLIRTIINDGGSLDKKTKSQLVYDFCSNNGISGSTNNQDSSDDSENQETSGSESNNSGSSSTDNPNVYIHSNGVTIIAGPEAEVGEKVIIDGQEWEVIDDESLLEKILLSNIGTLTGALDNVITSKVTNLSVFYNYQYNVTGFNSIKTWDVSNVTNMGFVFSGQNINADLSYWDVSKATTMYNMFSNLPYDWSGPGDISNWDVSNVTEMGAMFKSSGFNGDISNWDVSNVTNMDFMFENSLFNGDISNWDVSNVTQMIGMFENSLFNGDISNWDVSNVIIMGQMFDNSLFNGDISNWDVSNVTHMVSLFQDSPFNGDISNWDVSEVRLMQRMFNNNSSFNIDLSSWDVSKVTNCENFANGASNYTLPKPNFTNCDSN